MPVFLGNITNKRNITFPKTWYDKTSIIFILGIKYGIARNIELSTKIPNKLPNIVNIIVYKYNNI